MCMCHIGALLNYEAARLSLRRLLDSWVGREFCKTTDPGTSKDTHLDVICRTGQNGLFLRQVRGSL